jgi:transcriptional regulator with XRE-family HTH domain
MEKTTRKPKEKLSGNRIKFYMEQKGMIAEELAELTQMCPSFVSRIINNQRMCVSLPTALRIGRALQTPVEKLFLYEVAKIKNK